MIPRRSPAGAGVLAAAFFGVVPSALDAQLVPEPPITQMDLQLRTVRASGQPVIPIFEGWYPNEDGTYDLCFGFFNLNREEDLDIPRGPDNFIEPAAYDGGQPTHFAALGTTDDAGRRMQREYCVFTVNVPADVGAERVWWNLRIDGHLYRVPGHITSRPWRIDNLVNSVGQAMEEFEPEAAIAGAQMAPLVRFVDPPGEAARGKSRAVTAGPVTVRVGTPLTLTVSMTRTTDEDPLSDDANVDEESGIVEQSIKWTKFSGPAGEVSFSPRRTRVEVGPEPREQSTQVIFSEPGDYVLLVQVLDGSFSNQCCWTNAYVQVTVAP